MNYHRVLLAFCQRAGYNDNNYLYERQVSLMDEQQRTPNKEPMRRKKRSLERMIKEDYLPYVICGMTLLLVIIFIGGAIGRAVEQNRAEEIAASIAAAEAEAEAQRQHEQAIMQLIANADSMMDAYNYEGARTLLETYAHEMNDFPALQAKYNECVELIDSLVEWDNLADVVSMSFHTLIVDPDRAFSNAEYGTSFSSNHITCSEFTSILASLYDNNYILIDLDDIVSITEDPAGNVTVTPKSIFLPQGKKPLMLTETNVNYYSYMVDGDGDGLADEEGAGFAHKLVLSEEGAVTAQYITPDGETVTGDYDLVPILERFISLHPDFSYKGARAILAVTGLEGIFGYRIDSDAKKSMSDAAFEQEIDGAKTIVAALQNQGYTIACNTYGNLAYGKLKAADIQADLEKWQNDIAPIIPDVDIFVYAKNSQLLGDDYSSPKYTALKDAGFKVFLGFNSKAELWAQMNADYVRADRILVTGSSLTKNKDWYSGLFNPKTILDPARD